MRKKQNLALPQTIFGSHRKIYLANIQSILNSHMHRSAKDEKLSDIALIDPSLMLETDVHDLLPPYLVEAINQDMWLTASIVLDAGIHFDQIDLFGGVPFLSLRGSSKKTPSLEMVTMALERGYNANSRFLLPDSFGVAKSESMLERYTTMLQLFSAISLDGTTEIRSLIMCVRALILNGANEFDPITGPANQGSGFLALLCTARYLNRSTSKEHPDVVSETIELARLAVAHGASIDFNNCSGRGTLLTTVIKCKKEMMATELIKMGCDLRCEELHSPGVRMTLVDFARQELGDDGCAKIVEAVMQRQLNLATPKPGTVPIEPVTRRQNLGL